MTIFWHELKSNRTSIAVWSLSLSIMVLFFLSLFPAFTNDVATAQKVLTNIPLAVREALGISLGNFFTIFGFYGYLFTFVTLAGAIQAMNLGVGIISKEDSGKTADFLLAKPIGRSAIVTQKLSAAVCALVITNILFITAAFITATVVSTKGFDAAAFLLISLTLFLVQLVFLAIGLLLSVVIPRIKSVIAVSLPTTFAFFIIGSLGAIIGNANIRYITPFKFYDPAYIVKHDSYELQYVIIEVLVVIVAIAATYILFNKKDVRSAT
jgi:ABC-2 type transport system permease protein